MTTMVKGQQNTKVKTVKHKDLSMNPRVSEVRFAELLKAMSDKKCGKDKEKGSEDHVAPTP